MTFKKLKWKPVIHPILLRFHHWLFAACHSLALTSIPICPIDYWRGKILLNYNNNFSQVNFMITNALGSRRRRQSENNQQQQRLIRMPRSGAQLYRDLAQASGGQAVEVSRSQLLNATSVLTDSPSSQVITCCSAHLQWLNWKAQWCHQLYFIS